MHGLLFGTGYLMGLNSLVKHQIEDFLNESLAEVALLTANKSSTCYKLTTPKKHYFLKIGERSDISASSIELRLIAHYVHTPKLLCATETYFITEWIDAVYSPHHSVPFARELAALHQVTSTHFGFGHDNILGSIIQHNTKEDSWAQFFWQHRLRYQLILAYNNHQLTNKEYQQALTLEPIVTKALDIPITPVLLHGDLWSGNVLYDQDSHYFIDTACYYGHHEADLALGYIFGGFDTAFYTEYFKHIPKQSGFTLRSYLYQLYHYLNHLNMFGYTYKAATLKCISRLRTL